MRKVCGQPLHRGAFRSGLLRSIGFVEWRQTDRPSRAGNLQREALYPIGYAQSSSHSSLR